MASDNISIFDVNPFHLPNEILENIFAQLPLSATLSTYSHVCKSWAEVISNPFFLPWKKFYLSLKLNRKTPMSASLLDPGRHEERLLAINIMKSLLEKHNFSDFRSFLPDVIRFMGKVHKAPESFESSCERLKRHRLFTLADEFLKWVPDELISRPFNVWHLMSVIIILSEDVWDVCNIIHLLLSSGSNFSVTDVVESFYSMTSLFLYASRTIDLPIRYHYILYYALYLFENSWQPTKEKKAESHMLHSGQQSLLKYVESKQEKKPTHEQATIVSHKIQTTDIVKIVAFAGTGKTTTLLQFCKERPHLKFLLVVYNKSVQEHCHKIFPSNTNVKTAHGLAFANVGRRYSSIRKLDGSLKPMKIADCLETKENSGNRFKRAGLVKIALENFLNSASPFLTLQHVPENDKHGIKLSDNFRLDVLLDDAEKIWSEMSCCSNSQRVSMTQDGQLKEWQLSRPKLFGYDVIMIDEGQDMNPTMFDIFLNQDAAKVIVGDPYQQIYSFRGATNAIQNINATHTFYLTQSFRFGPEISFIGHNILENILKVSTKTLVGGSIKDSILHNPEDKLDGMQRAYLCRTNFCLYKLALQLCKTSKLNDKLIAFNGGLEKFILEDVLDIMKLVKRTNKSSTSQQPILFSNKFIARFENLEKIISYADNVEDKELLNKISMYKYSGISTQSDVNLLRNRCTSSVHIADIVLSTIHKAKGLEWDWVIMADDMLTDGLQVVLHDNSDAAKCEINLLYVAATRAKKRLTINTAVLHALNFGREKLERLTTSAELREDTVCVQCGGVCLSEERIKHSPPLVTKLATLPLSCVNYKFKGGFICDNCSELTLFEVAQNPRRLTNVMSETYVRDNERIARLVLLKGRVYTPSPETADANNQPIRWDKYIGASRN